MKESIEALEKLLEELGPPATPGILPILALAKSYGCAAKIRSGWGRRLPRDCAG